MKAFLFHLLIISILLTNTSMAQPSVGDSALNFNLPDTNGVYFQLDDFSGNIILFNFFASWCIPCQQEAPQVESEIWQAFQGQNVMVVGISVADSIFQIRNFVDLTGITYPILRDVDGSFFSEYGFVFFPANVLVNAQGTIEFVEEGFNIPLFVQMIDSLLNLTAISGSEEPLITSRTFELLGPYPNPFNSSVRIQFQVNKPGQFTFTLYDITGSMVKKEKQYYQSGLREIALEMNGFSSGVYIFSLAAGNHQEVGKFVLQK
ncbi:MAG: T9SS C-terminal target domain-containing protein [Calditrichaeota bacterium]|nr:MAG: T9SS C-terminal target domain-containing protein [Calditrichota bacterium]